MPDGRNYELCELYIPRVVSVNILEDPLYIFFAGLSVDGLIGFDHLIDLQHSAVVLVHLLESISQASSILLRQGLHG